MPVLVVVEEHLSAVQNRRLPCPVLAGEPPERHVPKWFAVVVESVQTDLVTVPKLGDDALAIGRWRRRRERIFGVRLTHAAADGRGPQMFEAVRVVTEQHPLLRVG